MVTKTHESAPAGSRFWPSIHQLTVWGNIGQCFHEGHMRRSLAFLLFSVVIGIPAQAAKHITVKQLDQGLADAKNKPDQELARWLYSLTLSERMSCQSLQHRQDSMPGDKSRKALTALADSSAFLNLPPEETPKTAPLDRNAQEQLLLSAVDYIEKTLSKLPNFFATETIATFEDTPASQDGLYFTAYEPLHYADTMRATVHYRGGKEVMETHRGEEVVEKDQTLSPTSGLLSSGEFGPVLKNALSDARSGKLTWGYWEKGATSEIAVFRYSVPRSKSHYKVKVLVPGHGYPFQARPGYHGEIAIDAASGTILRITLRADLTDDDPMSKADLMVEYGPVVIGGRTYICPTKSVALVMAYQEAPRAGASLNGDRHFDQAHRGPQQTLLNDVTFGHYQVLRSEARILTGADTNDDEDKP
jgi:hypothetical protein